MSQHSQYKYSLVQNGASSSNTVSANVSTIEIPTEKETVEMSPTKTTSAFGKFKLLFWKNWVLQARHPLQTAIEILAPVMFSLLLVLVRSIVDPKYFTTDTDFPVFDPCQDPFVFSPFKPHSSLAFAPNTSFIAKVVSNTSAEMRLKPVGFNSSETMVTALMEDSNDTFLAGITFPQSYSTLEEFPMDIEFSLHFPANSRYTLDLQEVEPSNWRTNILYPKYQVLGPRQKGYTQGGYPPGYYGEGFMAIQCKLSKAIILSLNSTKTLPDVKMRRFSYPPYSTDPLLQALTQFVPIIFMLSFSYSCISTVKVVTTEKEQKLKEAMKIMGLPNWLHWTAWFIKILIFLFISVFLITICTTISWYEDSEIAVFTYSSRWVIFIVLLFYVIATISFCFMVSVFFSNANTAATIAGLGWFLVYAPYLFLAKKEKLSIAARLISCLGHNSGMGFAFQLILMKEGLGSGMQLNSIWSPIYPDDDLVLGHILIMFVVDTVLYFLIAIYVEQIYPGDYGLPQPWYYPFQMSYWFGPKYDGAIIPSNNSTISDIIEKEPTHLNVGIQMQQLTKVYGRGNKQKTAVNKLTLNMYENQITVLLGHNGAGKSTTMSMLTGMIPQTSGKATVSGYDVQKNINLVRSSLGLCPQYNVLFEELTVEEHIYFFGRLKGLDKNQIQEEIDKYVKLLELEPKRRAKSATLSGGMKRKLSVAVALCGKSKVVLLDEPTAGMDPAARRALWDILQTEKNDRTILLSTHFMDEADLLGDRIAIMSSGVLQCCGSSFFLKKRYGTGYRLIMDKTHDCNVETVTCMLRGHIQEIKIDSNIGSELSYILPEEKCHKFEALLKDVEDNSPQLGVESFGISLTTLEEVFMKVGADHPTQADGSPYNKNNETNLANGKPFTIDINSAQSSNINGEKKSYVPEFEMVNGFELRINQYLAMFMKKILSTYRSWILIFIQMLIPVTFSIVCIMVTRNIKNLDDLPPMKMDIALHSRWLDTITVVNSFNQVDNDILPMYKDKLNKSKTIIDDISHLTKDIDDYSDYLKEKTTRSMAEVRQRYIIGFSSINESYLISWFNNDPYHGPGMSLTATFNALISWATGKPYSLTVYNTPLPYKFDKQLELLRGQQNLGFQLAFNMGFSMAFVSAFYILFYVRERVCKAKHLQFVSGVNAFTFWSAAYVWDVIIFLMTALLTVITIGLFQEDGFSSMIELGRVYFVLIVFGVSMIPLMYLASYLFEIPATGFTRMVLINIFTGVAAFLIVEVLKTPALDLLHVARGLEWFCQFIPHFSLSNSIRSLFNVASTETFCKRLCSRVPVPFEFCIDQVCQNKGFCCNMDQNYFGMKQPGCGRYLLASAATGLLCFLIVFGLELRIFERFIYWCERKKKINAPQIDNIDDDVLEEKNKINNASPTELRSYKVAMKNVTKYYKNFLAVNQLCVGLTPYECFGLLGVNGAGKTSTFKMMTGDVKISYGDAYVNGLDLKKDLKDINKITGYCPQFDALIDDMTGREILHMFSLLRGIPRKYLNYIANFLAYELDFTQHIDKAVKKYSGGNKRKLSTAVALLGYPDVIYLDEPTTGMDPSAKRNLWNVICRVRDAGHCVVLTSHSMEECEALCTRIAIMVNGNFQCLGSVQHLKDKFSKGYTLTIKLSKKRLNDSIEDETDTIKKFVSDNFSNAVLNEAFQGLLTYNVPKAACSWSRLFGIMEEAKTQLNIEDYSVGQCSFEQVFLLFTKYQREANSE